MRDIYFGDRRDRVKWGALVHLAQNAGLRSILQVAYLRDLEDRMLETPSGTVNVNDEVWRFFSSLDRVVELGTKLGLTIRVVAAPFARPTRSRYFDQVREDLAQMPRPALLFLDPDTGVSERAAIEHTARSDVECVWRAMLPGEWMVVYQHADHSSTWLDRRRALLARWCGGVNVVVYTGSAIARDVALLAAQRPP